MKEGDRSFVPYEVTSGRVAVGALTLVVVLVASRQPLPRGLRLWGHLAVAGLLMNAVPFTLIAWGEQRISSVAAGIWNATTPLFVVPVALLLLPAERPTRARAAGLLVGFLGVAVVFGAVGRALGEPPLGRSRLSWRLRLLRPRHPLMRGASSRNPPRRQRGSPLASSSRQPSN